MKGAVGMGTLNHRVLSFRPVNEWEGGREEKKEGKNEIGRQQGGETGRGVRGGSAPQLWTKCMPFLRYKATYYLPSNRPKKKKNDAFYLSL